MTCIVGWVQEGVVWMGADSAGMDHQTYGIMAMAEEKVFQNGPMLIGYTTSFRMGQLLRHSLVVPARADTQPVEHYMATTFVDAVRECFRLAGWAAVTNAQESGGDFLVGYCGRLFWVSNHFEVMEPREPYHAIGCAAYVAKGALFASAYMEPQPASQVARATGPASGACVQRRRARAFRSPEESVNQMRVVAADALRLIEALITAATLPDKELIARIREIAAPVSPADDATVEICLCAALYFPFEDGRVGGRIVRGHRHGDCFLSASSIKAIEDPRAGLQGFLTTRNRFVDRAEGFRLQIAAGIQSADRMNYRNGKLYSEDLY